jgi:hypothetical protein
MKENGLDLMTALGALHVKSSHFINDPPNLSLVAAASQGNSTRLCGYMTQEVK